jgi:hypothetical protein
MVLRPGNSTMDYRVYIMSEDGHKLEIWHRDRRIAVVKHDEK